MNEVKLRQLTEAAGPVSRETFERLLAFEALFGKWAARINLAGASTLDDLWQRHVVDSAQLLRLAPDALDWADLGSGGGFPGAVIAIALGSRPGTRIRLVESNRKKAAFLQAALAEFAPGAKVLAQRIEDVVASEPAPQIVTARALAPLDRLLDFCEPWLAKGTRALFHKGRDYAAEIEVAHDRWNLDLVQHASRVALGGKILEVRGVRRKLPTGS